jgi:hypothetical protein
MLGAITPENVYGKWIHQFKQGDPTRHDRFAYEVKHRLLSDLLGREVGITDGFVANARFEKPEWFTVMVQAMRLQMNEVYDLGLTEEEVLSVPVGQVPPLKETK